MPCSREHPSPRFCWFLYSPSTAVLARFLQTAPSRWAAPEPCQRRVWRRVTHGENSPAWLSDKRANKSPSGGVSSALTGLPSSPQGSSRLVNQPSVPPSR